MGYLKYIVKYIRQMTEDILSETAALAPRTLIKFLAFTSPSLLVVMSIRGLENSSTIGSIYGDNGNEGNTVEDLQLEVFRGKYRRFV